MDLGDVVTGKKLSNGAFPEGFMAGLKKPVNMQAPKTKDESFSVRHRKIPHPNKASLSMAEEWLNRKIHRSEAISKKFVEQNKHLETKRTRIGGTYPRHQYP